MANIKFGFVFKSMFGLLPKTSNIESAESALIEEYNAFVEYGDSEELIHIKDLKIIVESPVFVKKLDAMKADTFDKTEEFKKLQAYNNLKKIGSIKKCLEYKNSGNPEQIENAEKSEKLKKFNDVKRFILSSDFINKKKELEREKKFEGSFEAKKEQDFNQLKNDSDLSNYFKIAESSKYKSYIETLKSKEFADYTKLDELVNSQEFIDFKTEKEDTERYKETEEYKQLSEYESLMKKEEVVKYFGLLNSNKFDELKSWKLNFFDDFEGKELDKDKWITNYFWGKALLKEGYSLSTDLHCNTEGKNIEIKDSICRIITREEKAEGKSWNPRLGFYPREFNYTSGLLSTGDSFRQKYGKFQAKVRINSIKDVINAFWMVSDKMLPEIDVFKTGNKSKLSFINQLGNNSKTSISSLGGDKFKNEFFIFTLEWSKDKISWKINDILLKEVTTGIPTDPMYVIFSSGLNSEPTDLNLPSVFEIDWIKCYEKVGKE